MLTKNEELDNFEMDIYIDQEIEVLFNEISMSEKNIDEKQMGELVDNCKNVIIDSIIGPFGLSKFMFENKDGGNVTTTHNFKKGITATKEDRMRYDNWQTDYKEKERKYRREYEKKRDAIVERNIVHGNIDTYTGQEIEGKVVIDHVVSIKEVDSDPKANLFLSEEERIKMVNDDTNLKPTNASLNSSKNDKSMDEFLDGQATGAPEGVTNADKYGVDVDKAKEADKTSRKKMDKTIMKAQIKKQGSELIKTGGKEGLAMGARQVIGFILKEFTEALFYEIRDMMAKAKDKIKEYESFFEELKERLKRLVSRITDKWKEALTIFKDGVISGFFSNFITFLINNFATTMANFVSIIREGFNSLVRAIKILIYPPEHLTRAEAVSEAAKILLAGFTVCLGIMFEEAVKKFLESSPLAPFANLLAPVITGIITGIGTLLVVYAFDKIKNSIEIRHQSIVNANRTVLIGKYKTLETAVILDKALDFTQGQNAYMEDKKRSFQEITSRNEEIFENNYLELNSMLSELRQVKDNL